MPILDGIQSTARIRNLPEELKSRTPIVALTGNADTECLEKCMATSFNDVLTKPVSMQQLLNMIKKITQQSVTVATTSPP
jgi:CheY-like chemotaxis protein